MRAGTHDDPVRPKGSNRSKSRLRAGRSPVYVPVGTISKTEQALWLMANKHRQRRIA